MGVEFPSHIDPDWRLPLKRIPTMALAASVLALAGCAGSLPETTVPAPESRQETTAAPVTISPSYLRTHLTAFAHDSMQGREAGTPGHLMASRYLAQQLERIGAEPAGEDGTFFQNVPLITNALDLSAPLMIDGAALEPGMDYAPVDQRTRIRSIAGAQVVYGGTISEVASLPAEEAAGRFVIVSAEPGRPLLPRGGPASNLAEAVGVGVTGIDPLFNEYADYFVTPSAGVEFNDSIAPQPVVLLLPEKSAERFLGAAQGEWRRGMTGVTLGGDVRYNRTTTPSPNVVAVLQGSDPALRGQYIAIGAHSDHMGIRSAGPLDHDSLRAVNVAVRNASLANQGQLAPDAREQIVTEVASQRRSAGARPDSIFNGADDDGSGSIGLLALAEYFADPANRPRRSLLLVWHTAEEKGLIGSEWFTDNPTVPLDSIVAHINLDMIGRGSAEDLPGGGPDYLQILGPKRLSTEYARLIEGVNARRTTPFRLDDQYDAPGHPEQYYCRSDHWNYARYGIPVAFFTTGDHADYHQLTDEVQYIDFDHYASVVSFIGDIAAEVGNRDKRPRVDGRKPDPKAPCRQ